jgi:hypothetical protein
LNRCSWLDCDRPVERERAKRGVYDRLEFKRHSDGCSRELQRLVQPTVGNGARGWLVVAHHLSGERELDVDRA